MQTINLAVPDIADEDRRALEHVLGQPLRNDQRLSITVLSAADTPTSTHAPGLPAYLNLYEGMTDDQILQLEQAIAARVRFSRPEN